MISKATYKLLVASKFRGVGRRGLQDLFSDKLFFQSPIDDLGLAVSGIANPAPDAHTLDAAVKAADADVEIAERMGHFIVGLSDLAYPKLLRDVPDHPPILFMNGNPQRLSDKSVAVIGTREPSKQGE